MPPAPGLIFDDEALAELVAELVRDDARGDVGNAASAEGNDYPNRPVRVILRLRGGRERQYQGHKRVTQTFFSPVTLSQSKAAQADTCAAQIRTKMRLSRVPPSPGPA